jgi:hypothetical protein
MVTIVAIINMGTITSMSTIFINAAMLAIIRIRDIVKITTILIIGMF